VIGISLPIKLIREQKSREKLEWEDEKKKLVRNMKNLEDENDNLAKIIEELEVKIKQLEDERFENF
jgi:hypothetical protein